MDSFQNPEQFQNSSVVQKSSKTGIFSNKRLLVIKNGYLYYFSKVPKGYKSHVPNILTTFTDLPKSSIEIKNILDIRLESTKSSNLIIKFYLRDMIDRQDIRKSIDTHSYMLPQKKVNTDFDEWKFTFTTVLQCRLWFNALIKLKDYFKNLDIKFQKFVSNFDKRSSVIIESTESRTKSQLKLPSSSNIIPLNSSTFNQKSQQVRKTQPIINFDASKFMGSIPEKQLSPMNNNKIDIQVKQQEPLKIHIEEFQIENKIVSSSKMISQEVEDSQYEYHPNIPQITYQPQVLSQQIQHPKKHQHFKPTLQQSHLIIQPINEDEQIKIRQIQQQIREQVKQQVEQKVRQQVLLQLREKMEKQKKQEIAKFKTQVELKQIKIKQLQTEIHIKHLANMEKQKMIEEEKKQLQNKIYEEQEKLKQYKIDVQIKIKEQNKLKNNDPPREKIDNCGKPQINLSNHKNEFQSNNKKWIDDVDSQQMVSRSQNYGDETTLKQEQNDKTKPSSMFQNHIEVQQFSVQTQDEEFQMNQSDEFEPHFNFSKDISLSKQLNLSKETKIRNSFFSDILTSNRNTLRIEEDILSYDQQQQKEEFSKFRYFSQLSKVFENRISSSEKIDRQIKLLRYVNFIKNQVVKISQEFIENNQPAQCITFEKGFLTFDLACAPGKIMNIGGEKKLIYSNKVHENLKRTFKIYQKLQVQIMKLIKSKRNFPVRVPLCVLVQFKGYTVLGKAQLCCNEEDMIEKDKYLKYLLPAAFHSNVQLSKIIQIDDESQFYMVKVLKSFKIANEQKNSEVLNFNNSFHLCENQIFKCRASSVSICYEKLSKEYKQIRDQGSQSRNQQQAGKNSQFWALRLIKLMRELKKIFKSIEPFSKYENEKNQRKSQFVQTLISNPKELLGLIPSEIDFKTQDTKCGYFWSLLQSFLGIKMNDLIKQNTENPNYRLVPVVRTYYFESLLCNQYCEKMDKYLASSNIQSTENCWKLLKKVSSSELQPSLVEIKILLKKKQYSIAEQKIHQLRESLSLHDLKNIQINAYLIQCYIFMGLETEALTEIKSSLEYVEYLFNERKNSYEENLHLLMAETLLKMGSIKQAIKLYKSLLKFDKIDKEQIIVRFAENLVLDYRFDPNQTIPFLIQCVEELNSLEKKILLYFLIANLYSRSERRDKCIFYLQKTYELSISSKSYDQILEIYKMLMSVLPNQSKKQVLYHSFLQQMESKFFKNHQNSKYFNTINLYQLMIENQELKSNEITYFLDEIRIQSGNELSANVELKSWENLRSCAKILFSLNPSEIEGNLKTVTKTLESIDISKLLDQFKKTHIKLYQN